MPGLGLGGPHPSVGPRYVRYFEEPEDPPASAPVVRLEPPWEVFEPLTRQASALLEKDEAPRYPHAFDSHPART